MFPRPTDLLSLVGSTKDIQLTPTAISPRKARSLCTRRSCHVYMRSVWHSLGGGVKIVVSGGYATVGDGEEVVISEHLYLLLGIYQRG